MKKGLTESGFSPETYSEIANNVFSELKDKLGPINTNDASVIGQTVNVFAIELAKVWYAASEVFNSNFVDTARGVHLDGKALERGIIRLQSTKSTVLATLTGNNQIIIPSGSQISGFGVNTIFSLDEDVVLSNTLCFGAVIEVNNVDLDEYKIILENQNVIYQKQAGDGLHDILTGLSGIINSNWTDIEALISGDYLIIQSTSEEPFDNTYISEGLSLVTITTKAKFTALESGFIPAAAKSLNIINTPVFGWLSVINEEAADTGRDLESDQQLKARIYTTFDATGTATVPAVKARLRNVQGVRSVSVNENNTNVQQGDLPPKSVECVILGGDDNDIAQTVWAVKGGGIEYVGNTTVTIVDSENQVQQVKFSRPVNLYIFVKVQLNLSSGGYYPDDGDERIKQSILDQINKLELNQDVLYQSFYSSVYDVGGVISANITCGGTLIESEIPALTASNINVGSSQIAVSDLTKIIIEK